MRKIVTLYLSLLLFVFSTINIFSQPPVITTQPTWQGVVEGDTASFSVEASGTGLTYQWYKNDTLITGATDSIYKIQATISDSGSAFSVKVTNVSGSDSSKAVKLFVTAAGNRVTSSLQLLYNFNEGSGDIIHDNSGVGSAFNLTIGNPAVTVWTSNGLGINDIPYINSLLQPATKVINAAKTSNELTLETWIRPAIMDQVDGARILTLSQDYLNANLEIMQINHKYVFRIRTTATDNRGEPSLFSSSSITSLALTHIVLTRASDGTLKLYINGVEDTLSVVSGDFSNWDPSYKMQIGNEYGSPRPWLGTYYLLSVYNRALSKSEVEENYNIGVSVENKPEIIIDPKDIGLLEGESATFSVSAVGTTPFNYQWRKNGVDISGADSSSYTIPSVSVSDGGNVYSVIISNASGSAISRNATLYVNPMNERITSGQIALYKFQDGVGDTVRDQSGYSTPLNLKINDTNAVMWKPYGLVIDSATSIASTTNASKISNAVIASNAFTFEAWIKPENLTQNPATIFTIANEIDPLNHRNFSVNQIGIGLQSWIRISTSNEGGSEFTPSYNVTSDSLLHIVFIRNAKEFFKVYINGVEISSVAYLVGDLSNWNTAYPLELANQFSVNHPWKGIFNLVSFYDRALDSLEVVHNYEMGPNGEINIKSPANLTAKVLHAGMVELTWADSSNNEDGFIIERQIAGTGSFEVIDTVNANDTSYSDSNVTDTTSYKYRIKAYNLVTESGYSNEVTIKTLLSTIPAPTELSAITYNPDTVDVKLTWKDNSSNELGFVIQRKLGDTASVSPYINIDSTAADITTYTDTTTNDTTQYTYRIYAYNADTVSAYSNKAQATTPLPVELTSFSVNEINGKVLLNWETATEINNAGFGIERSTDNKKFSEIAFIKGKGTTTEKTSYSYTDKSALSGKYYYKLKQVDFDGTYHYSKSVEVEMGLPTNYSLEQNYPNPFNPTTTIRFALPMDAKVNIKLYNTLGQEVANIINTNLNAGVHETVFNASNLSSGVYFYRIEAKGIDGSVFTSTKRLLLLK